MSSPPGDIDPSLLPHDTAGPRLNVSVWVLFSLSSIFLSLRVYCKYLGRRGLWWDDWILVVSWVLLLVCCALISHAVAYGFGHHAWDIPEASFPVVSMALTVRTTLIMTAAAWSKTAFAVTLLRITDGRLRWVLWFIIISMNIAMGLSAMIGWVTCKPLAKAWDPTLDGTCWDQSVITKFSYVASSYSAACDFALALLPWRVVWHLQMKTSEKVGVGVAMSMGILAGIMAIVKTVSLRNLGAGDIYFGADLNIWDTTEVAVTIIAASIPVLRVLIREVKTSSRRYYLRSGEGETGGSRIHAGHHRVVVKSKPQERRDDYSDKSILGMSSSKIYQTREVEVEFTETNDDESFEMTRQRTPRKS